MGFHDDAEVSRNMMNKAAKIAKEKQKLSLSVAKVLFQKKFYLILHISKCYLLSLHYEKSPLLSLCTIAFEKAIP